jgi:hypothetical protein
MSEQDKNNAYLAKERLEHMAKESALSIGTYCITGDHRGLSVAVPFLTNDQAVDAFKEVCKLLENSFISYIYPTFPLREKWIDGYAGFFTSEIDDRNFVSCRDVWDFVYGEKRGSVSAEALADFLSRKGETK